MRQEIRGCVERGGSDIDAVTVLVRCKVHFSIGIPCPKFFGTCWLIISKGTFLRPIASSEVYRRSTFEVCTLRRLLVSFHNPLCFGSGFSMSYPKGK